jgi:transposase
MAAAVPGANGVRCLTAFYFILHTGAPWAGLPDRYPPYQTCHRRFQQWVRSGVIRGVRLRGRFHLEKACIDGSFALAKKEGAGVGKTKRTKETKIMAVADGTGLPVAICAESATPHEVTLVQQTLSDLFIADR